MANVDTTEIRAHHLPGRCGRTTGPRCHLCEAVDTLDVARAELNEQKAVLRRAEMAWRREVQRFKNDAGEQQRRAEAAEVLAAKRLEVNIDMAARIAAACVILTEIHPEVRTEAEHNAYRALTA